MGERGVGGIEACRLDGDGPLRERNVLLWRDSGSHCGQRLVCCSSRIEPGLLSVVDGHAQVFGGQSLLGSRCAEVTAALFSLWRRGQALLGEDPVFVRRGEVPPIAALWELHCRLASSPARSGLELAVQFDVDGSGGQVKARVVAVFLPGAPLSWQEWSLVMPVLTTCTAEVSISEESVHPVLPPGTVRPRAWIQARGGTWWSYRGSPRSGCPCPACAPWLSAAERVMAVGA